MGFGQTTVVVNQGDPGTPVTQRQVSQIGNNAYTFIDAHSTWIIAVAPQTRKAINLKRTGVSAGSSVKIDNGGLAPMDFTPEQGVSIFPAGVKSLPAGSSAIIECLQPGAYWVDVARRSQVQLGAPVREDIDPIISLTGSTFSLDFAGVWAGDVHHYRFQFCNDGVDIAGASGITPDVAATMAKTSSHDGHSITCKVWAIDKLGHESATYALSNALVLPATPGTSPPVLTGTPRFVLVDGTPVTQVEVGTTIYIDPGGSNPAATSLSAHYWNPPAGGGAAADRGTSVSSAAPWCPYTTVANDANETVYADLTPSNTNGAGSPVAVAAINVVPAGAAGGGGGGTLTPAAALAYDVAGAGGPTIMSEALPKGLYNRANADWSKWPRGMTSKTVYRTGTGVKLHATGVLYQKVGGNPSPCKVKLRDLQIHLRYNDGTIWTPPNSHDVACNNGSLYYEDFHGQIGGGSGSSTPTSRSTTADGSTLIHLPDPAQPDTGGSNDRCYHFFGVQLVDLRNGPQSRANIDGIIVAVRACLDPLASAADIAAANYTLEVGCDAKTATDGYLQDVGLGRFKIVKPGWRVYTMCSASTAGSLPTLAGVLSNQEYVNP